MLTVTKRFTFEAAHNLTDYKGPCANPHGHSYKLWVTVSKVDGGKDPSTAMVIDFKDLKAMVEPYVNAWDHSNLNDQFNNPTAERMVEWLANSLNKTMPVHLVLQEVRLYETEDSYAEWRRTCG